MPSDEQAATSYQQASIKTANDLRTMTKSTVLSQLSRLSLPEIEHLTDEVARVVPAGNVPGIILSGLARLGGREITRDDTEKQIGMLFKGVRQMLDKAIYGTFFAGPAAILYGYQQLLRLAGKDTNSAFPDGVWQFYLEFALREDSAHHTSETIGFHKRLTQQGIQLNEADMLAAWLLASTHFLKQLPDILANEWHERMVSRILEKIAVSMSIPDAGQYQELFTEWQRIRPFQLGADAGGDDYAHYRRRVFTAFIKPYIENLPPAGQQMYQVRRSDLEKYRLPAYQQQMSWLAYLEPDSYHETRIPYELEDGFVGVILNGHYYLLPVPQLFDLEAVRQTALALLQSRPPNPRATLDDALVNSYRGEQPALRGMLDRLSAKEVEYLRRAPIIINWDEQSARQPLVMIRQAKRGIGDHPLTIFRTDESMVFDQSHIFFDGIWGTAIAEMMTNEALHWATRLAHLPATPPAQNISYSPVLKAPPALVKKANSQKIATETGAENEAIHLGSITALRKLLKQRNDLVQVTVNDLLLLYRGLHALLYKPSLELQQSLAALAAERNVDAKHAHQIIQDEITRLQGKNPSLLIPLDASRNDPRQRIFPTTFRNPLTDFYTYHTQCLSALNAYRASPKGKHEAAFKKFHNAQLNYLRVIGSFGELLTRYRNIALAGQSTSTASIRFLGNMPPAMQKLLDTIPGKFDVLNEIIKGEEVFSNMGRVSKGSTLRRFITAKDDNEQKTLAWGVITDDKNLLHLSLRDFRPHVGILCSMGMNHLAQRVTQDYLDAYANGLNQYVTELRDIVTTSHESLASMSHGKIE
ncbi:MAG: hypothetical protein ABI690_11115 [Chloroflexota bacterium]